MKVVKANKDAKGFKVTFADEKQEKEKQRQAKFSAFADKKAKGKLTLDDVDAKLNMIIEILEELLTK